MVAVYHISELLITLHVSFTNCLMLFPLAPATRGYFALKFGGKSKVKMLITRSTDCLVVVCLAVSTKIISQLMLRKGDIF